MGSRQLPHAKGHDSTTDSLTAHRTPHTHSLAAPPSAGAQSSSRTPLPFLYWLESINPAADCIGLTLVGGRSCHATAPRPGAPCNHQNACGAPPEKNPHSHAPGQRTRATNRAQQTAGHQPCVHASVHPLAQRSPCQIFESMAHIECPGQSQEHARSHELPPIPPDPLSLIPPSVPAPHQNQPPPSGATALNCCSVLGQSMYSCEDLVDAQPGRTRCASPTALQNSCDAAALGTANRRPWL